jgi:hypothetical protein
MNKFDVRKWRIILVILILAVFLFKWAWNPISNSESEEFIEKQISYLDTWFCDIFIKKWYYFSVWTDTKPAINATHIFCWEINKRGKPVGFHHRQYWKDPSTVKVEEIIYKNKDWLYQAKVEILDIKYNLWKEKFSTMFPDRLNRQEVLKNILYAWQNRYYFDGVKFRWPSISGDYDIEGYLLSNTAKINTAYPIFKE